MDKQLKSIKKYWLEIGLLLMAIIIALAAIFIYSLDGQNGNEQSADIITAPIEPITPYIYVDLSGEINKPDVYKLKSGSRLVQLIKLAGGITNKADRNFFNQNYNQARILADQEKIYIPSSDDIANGYLINNTPMINCSSSFQSTPSFLEIININTATSEELDSLPGIGLVTAEKIITNRPFGSIDDLVNKKVIKSNVFEQIKNKISVN